MRRKHHWPVRSDATGMAINRAALLDDAERARILQPLQAAFVNLRRGVGTYEDWTQMASAMNVAQAIEHQRVVRGLHGHLHTAELTLETIQRRAQEDSASRYPYALFLNEMDVLQTAIDLHAFQIGKLSRSEYTNALTYAAAEVLSSGGTAIPVPPQRAQVQEALPL
jgi:hypothetical protein